jgi:DNA topoisomerase-1
MAAKYKALVIVESPTKVSKIQAFLGKDYKVLASMGHVRDLPAKAAEVPTKYKKETWASLGVNVDENFEPLYVIPESKKKTVKDLKAAYEDSESLIIATDSDREGESIGWHLIQLLEADAKVERMTFTEITKEAIQKALQNKKKLNLNLVDAQETRRVLDRLYGYTLSPLLWKKIARGLSAGRVQSLAVKILVERELERLAFRSGHYWGIKALLANQHDESFPAQLVKVGDQKIASGKDFDESTGKLKEGSQVLLLEEKEARALEEKVKTSTWVISNIDSSIKYRKPYPPFTTSTLQQEANRKLYFTARQTMQIAQKLYENGHITYMRTDSVSLSQEAINATRNCIEQKYGRDYLSPEVRQFSNKSKNAQEAHEAIRPAGTEMKTAEDLGITGPEGKLYSMIWKRTMATQMAEARLRFETITIQVADAEFRATGRVVEFPGFFRAYVEGVDDPDAALDDQETALPQLSEKEKVNCKEIEATSHETKPPARYTEATLVKKLEAEGVGRPSTYATIIGTVQDRGYVVKTANQLIPTFTAMAVHRLLETNFPDLIDLGFTADMEQKLDDIALGEYERLPYLKKFYSGELGLANQVKVKEEKIDAREACTLTLENLATPIRVGRYGPYFEKKDESGESISVSIPPQTAPGDLNDQMLNELTELKKRGPQSIGIEPESGLPIFVMNGPFGPYLQLGEVQEGQEKKPKRVSIPKNYNPLELKLEKALALISLPRRLGHHPETNKVVNAGIGRFGPYVVSDGKYKSLGKDQDVLTVDLETAVELLAQAKQRASATPLRELGNHTEEGGKAIAIYDGRYGPYIKYGKINATLPKDQDVQTVTLEQAIELIDAKASKTGVKKKVPTKKVTKKKTSRKKAAKK